MIERTANPAVDSRAKMMQMLLPLALFFAACFLFTGALKFHIKGGDLWIARPAGTTVTCLFLALVGLQAGRWFFGSRAETIPKLMLAALVVLLPIMGLLGVVQLSTHDADSAASDPTPLGGTLGTMLAGPRAFGALGTTVAGIVFATLALLGAYLARRMTAADRARPSEDPYAVMRTISAKKAAMPEAGGGVAVAEEEAPAGDHGPGGGDLFPADVELEPEASEVGAVESFESVEVVEAVEPPRRVPILAGIVDETEDALIEEALPAARFLASTLTLEPEEDLAALDFGALLVDDASKAETAVQAEPEEATALDFGALLVDDASRAEAEAEEARPDAEAQPEAEPEVERHVITPPPPSIEADDETSPDSEGDDDSSMDEPELDALTGGEAPELTPEWLVAPSQFHTPRMIEDLVATNETLDILDVEQVKVPEPEAPPVERPRFRIKADYVRHEVPVVEEPEVAIEPEVERAAEPVEVLEVPEPAAPVMEETAELPDNQTPIVEAQLEFPSMPEPAAPAATETSDADSPRPKRRMRSAKKDWATWDEQPASKERPRLRLVKSEDETAEAAGQTEIPVAAPSGDDTYDRAVALVVDEDRCSVSLLQRNLGVTFGEATALIDRMYQQGVVGPYQPTGRRDVLLGKKGAESSQ